MDSVTDQKMLIPEVVQAGEKLQQALARTPKPGHRAHSAEFDSTAIRLLEFMVGLETFAWARNSLFVAYRRPLDLARAELGSSDAQRLKVRFDALDASLEQVARQIDVLTRDAIAAADAVAEELDGQTTAQP
jgi:hypothetical protein